MINHSLKIYIIIWRIILIGLILFFLIWIMNKNLFSNGLWSVEKNFSRHSLIVSDLYPKERLNKFTGSGAVLAYEPIYFKVKMPVMFERVKVLLVYKTEDNLNPSLGLLRKRIKPTDWDFELKKLEPQLLEDNLFEAKTDFALNAGFVNNHYLEFMISAPEVRQGAYLEIREIKLELSRQPLTYREALNRGFDYLREVF